ncbi:MAG: ECF transporter S component [Candidatus Izimaplasma sp.]|nr:ECF transporter S component [Candidatus Izimaplasma bacterium]
MRSKQTEQIVFAGLFVAIVFVATYFIQIPTTGISGGLIHLGNIAMFSIALKYGKKYGAISGGIGMMLFDLFSAWFVWAPATLVVRGVMGFVIGLIAHDKNGQGSNIVKNIIAIGAGAVVMLTGYLFFEAVILGVGWAAIGSVPGNLVQLTIGLIALGLVPFLPDMKKDEEEIKIEN